MHDEYIASYGDTWDNLAFQFYDDPMYASTLIQANPDYADVLIFEESVTLKIPVIDTVETPPTLPPWRQ